MMMMMIMMPFFHYSDRLNVPMICIRNRPRSPSFPLRVTVECDPVKMGIKTVLRQTERLPVTASRNARFGQVGKPLSVLTANYAAEQSMDSDNFGRNFTVRLMVLSSQTLVGPFGYQLEGEDDQQARKLGQQAQLS